MPVMNETTKQRVQQLFDKELERPLQILLFHNDADAETAEYTEVTREILGELAPLSNGRLTVRAVDASQSDEAGAYGIDRVPALVFLDEGGNDQRFRFFGAPIGYEFMALLEDIVDVSKGKTRLTDDARTQIQAIQEETLIQVFSTPG